MSHPTTVTYWGADLKIGWRKIPSLLLQVVSFSPQNINHTLSWHWLPGSTAGVTSYFVPLPPPPPPSVCVNKNENFSVTPFPCNKTKYKRRKLGIYMAVQIFTVWPTDAISFHHCCLILLSINGYKCSNSVSLSCSFETTCWHCSQITKSIVFLSLHMCSSLRAKPDHKA